MDYSKLSTKKLIAMLETATAMDAVNINTVLKARAAATEVPAQETENEASADVPSTEAPAEELTAEEQATIDEAKAAAAVSNKKTFESQTFLAEKLKVNLQHECEVVPFNTATFEKGVIVGISVDKRSLQVLYAIKLADGRRIVKAHDSKLLKISETVSTTVAAKTRTSSGEKATAEDLAKLIDGAVEVVGNFVSYVPFGKTEPIIGLITSIVPEKRSNCVLLRIESENPLNVEGEAVLPKTIAHKVFGSSQLTMTGEVDETVKADFAKRRAALVAAKSITIEEQIEKATAAVTKAETALETAKTVLAELIAKQAAKAAEAPAETENLD